MCEIILFQKNYFIKSLVHSVDLLIPCYSVWHLVVQILFKFFQSQNQFSLDWLNLQSNKNFFAHYILPRVQKNFRLFIGLDSSEKAGSEWVIIFPQICMTKCQTLYIEKVLYFWYQMTNFPSNKRNYVFSWNWQKIFKMRYFHEIFL